MLRILKTIIIFFIFGNQIFGQKLDSLKLSKEEIPENYSLTNENKCNSIQAKSFYDNPEIYNFIIGKVKTKAIQQFENKSDSGCIMYFEFDDNFKGNEFLGGLLWGGERPTKQHPEEFIFKDKFLIIWSLKKDSNLKNLSKEKTTKQLK